jgi:hypothetical protein
MGEKRLLADTKPKRPLSPPRRGLSHHSRRVARLNNLLILSLKSMREPRRGSLPTAHCWKRPHQAPSSGVGAPLKDQCTRRISTVDRRTIVPSPHRPQRSCTPASCSSDESVRGINRSKSFALKRVSDDPAPYAIWN